MDLETQIALAFMKYIANLDVDELHSEDEIVFNNFIDEC
jgi:hypothetical protein